MRSLSILLFLYTSTILLFIVNIYTVDCERVVHGRYTRDIKEYHLTVPRKISSSGEHVTFKLREYYEHDFKRRKRRDTGYSDDSIFYNVVYNGVDHHIELWPNHGAFSPNLVIERYEGPNTPVANRKIRLMDRKQCHYVGKVKGDAVSRVAMSVCDGLVGYLLTRGERYYIEPLADTQPNANGEQVHVVYQKNIKLPKPKDQTCHSGKNWEKDWTYRLREEYRKRRDNSTERKPKSSNLHSIHRYLETLIVADQKFLKFHKNTDHEKYIMTIMNMVSDYYHDASAGNQMDVVVVRIIHLDKPEKSIDLETSPNAEETLENFCKWQETINPADINNPQHHDIAVLLTRYDICSDNMSNCDLMGLAYVAAACTGNKPCAINEDAGLTLGVVVAHEMGHVMGCSHDNEVDSPCTPLGSDGAYHVMSPYVHLHTSLWSACSRKFITIFLENRLGDCLNDEPQESLFHDDNMLAGSIYDADFQCDLLFPNMNVKACKTSKDIFCKSLYCKTKPSSCSSNGDPPADGTKCGENMWCFEGACIRIGKRTDNVDGGWGPWGNWSTCSRTCGAGITFQERDCNNPKPKNHGRYCLGERKKVKICNSQVCPENCPTFREVQCTEFNNKPFKGKIYIWKPYLKPGDVCSLFCINEKNTFVKLAPRVKDGTLCKPGSHDRCIFGVCTIVGCDMKINSDKVEDICGICDGDGSQCTVVSDTFVEQGEPGYKKLMTIPKRARNILIEEMKPSTNTIALGTNEENMFLNGNYEEEPDGLYKIGGVDGIYEHPELDRETLTIVGPLTQDVNLYFVFYEVENPGLRYQFSIPLTPVVAAAMKSKKITKVYEWEFLNWSECSKRCNTGAKTSRATCVEKHVGKVAAKFCKAPRPEDKVMTCNNQPCTLRWYTGPWSKCSGCKFRSGMKTRDVDCVSEAEVAGQDDVLQDDEMCIGSKPAEKQLCCSAAKCPVKKRRYIDEFEEKLGDLWYQINEISKREVEEKYGKELKLKEGQIRHSKIHSYLKKTHRERSSDDCNTTNIDPVILAAIKKQQDEEEANEVKKDECDNVKGIHLRGNTTSVDVGPPDKKIIEADILLNQESLNITDEVEETMGDKIYDALDICHEKTFTGKDADNYMKKMKADASELKGPAANFSEKVNDR